MSRNIFVIVVGVVILVALNGAIFEKEQLKKNGDTVLLALAPVDPRSLMQGDYMALRYEIERRAPLSNEYSSGYLVVTLDQNKVGSFKRFYQDGETLTNDEKLLRYRPKRSSIQIAPNAFFFQEGQGKLYQKARYGEFKVDQSGNHLLVGLVDEHFKRIEP